jgi:hypothetical protein
MINPKHIIVSWKHQGSIFCIDSIRENFPELISHYYFYKTHDTIEQVKKNINFKSIDKVFFIIADPRNSSINLNFYKQYGDFSSEYKIPVKFVNRITQETINLLKNWESQTKIEIIKFEDMIYKHDETIKKIGEILNLEPLYIDDHEKYKKETYRVLNKFDSFYDVRTLSLNYKTYENFYKRFGYTKMGEDIGQPFKNSTFEELLKRNNKYSDEIIKRYPGECDLF